ncbi:MAG: aminotransferase class V-fold PLP-dependent enzyme [Candidatus Nanopelagicales bacterium]
MTNPPPPVLEVERLRAETPGCASVTHLNNAGSALPPAVVTQTQVDHLRLEEAIGGYEAHARAQDRIDAVYDSIAELTGCRRDQVALVESATAAWGRGFAAIHNTRPLGAGDRVLASSSEYASNVLPILQLARSRGVTVEFIPDDADGCTDVEAFSSMLGPDVAVVAVNHCPSQNGLVNDVAAIGAVLRSSGSDAWYLVDACQSVGQLPVSASAIGADVLSATGRKFLRGPRGTGFLVASDRAITELEPFPLDLHSAVWQADGYDVASGATRFESWEKSYAALLGLGAAVDYALDCGIDALAARIGQLAAYARASLAAVHGVTVRDRGAHPSGIVTITHSSFAAPDLAARIKAAGVNVSLSTPDYSRVDFDGHGVAGLVRISPHAYNTEAEIDRLVAIIRSLS